MTHSRAFDQTARRAFTLIELLVVIAIIAILASLIFPAVGAIKKRATINKVQTELNGVKTAIELFKEKYNSYPPDNPGNPALNQLFFELSGTEPYKEGGEDYYRTFDQSTKIKVNSVSVAFGPKVNGFANSTRGSGDDVPPAKDFLKGLKPGEYVSGSTNGVAVRLLTCSVQWPNNLPAILPGLALSDPGVNPNPWRYNSSNPTNNPGSYDLWVDVLIGNKTNRISNWSKVPQIVATP